MAELVNLRQARKRKARDAKRRAADANAGKHGQPKVERRLLKAEQERADRALDGHRREPSDD